MKYLILVFAVISFNVCSETMCINDFDESSALVAYQQEDFKIYLLDDESDDRHKLYELYAKHNSGCVTNIGSTMSKGAIKVVKWAPGQYVFSNYVGGNSVASENRMELILVSDSMVSGAGDYSCVSDVDGDGIQDFCKIEDVVPEGGSMANRTTKRIKLNLVNGKLISAE